MIRVRVRARARAYFTATEVQVQVTEVAVEGEALQQRPVEEGQWAHLYHLDGCLPRVPWAPPTSHPPDLRASRGSLVADRLTWLRV